MWCRVQSLQWRSDHVQFLLAGVWEKWRWLHEVYTWDIFGWRQQHVWELRGGNELDGGSDIVPDMPTQLHRLQFRARMH
jgi:hypothetical protein